ncbi:UNVERIFIED_CONTAM: hypothetical protein FKN15_031526 [Acipenser sinensis]
MENNEFIKLKMHKLTERSGFNALQLESELPLLGNTHAVMDLTLINPDPIVTNSEASLLCVNSEWSIPDVPNIGRDLALPNQQMSQHASHDDSHRFALKVTWQERSSDIFGAFYCGERSKDSSNKVYTVKMLDEACPPGYYGAGCKLKCECRDRGVCDRFRGCLCKGWHGQRCEKEGSQDVPPQVTSNLRDVELNYGITYSLNCSATGYPPLLHGEIMLLKPDKTTVEPTDTQTLSSQSTALFKVEKIQLRDSGTWSCQVNTASGYTEKSFNVDVKVSPTPLYAPTLNSSGPYHLVISINKEPYNGDGPITSVKLLYKSAMASQSWSSIEVNGPLVKLEKLNPMTVYNICVQLSRQGDGGQGHPGPEASCSTAMLGEDCLCTKIPSNQAVKSNGNLPPPSGVKLIPISQTSLSLMWEPVAGSPEEERIYQVECSPVNDRSEKNIFLEVLRNFSSVEIKDLEPKQMYQCKVRVTCKSVGQWSNPVSAWTFSDELPPPPFNIQKSNITDSSAIISWSLEEGNSVSSVIIRYKNSDAEDYSQQTEINVREHAVTQFQLRGLKSDTHYMVEIWAKNNIGVSQGNPRLEIKTRKQQDNHRATNPSGCNLLHVVAESVGAPTTLEMETIEEFIAMIKRNTAAQQDQNKKWRVELGLPEPEPTELDQLLQKWKVELPSREPEEEELPLPEPRGEELPLPEPRGEELPLPEPRGEELPLPEPRGEEPSLPEPRGEEPSLPEPRGEEPSLPEPRGEEPSLPEPRGEEPSLPEPRGEELPLPEPRGEELPLPEPRGEELPLPEPRGEELPLPEPRGEKPPLPEPREEVKKIPPPQPRPPPLKASPALPCVVPCPGIVDTLPECPDLPTLDLAPRSQHCQAQLFAWSLSQLPLKPQTSRHGSQTSLTLPLPPTVFPLRLQTSLCRSTASHLCLPFLAPGHRPALQSPRASRPGPSSPVLGPFQEAPEGPTHPQARPWKRAKIKEIGLEALVLQSLLPKRRVCAFSPPPRELLGVCHKCG